MYKTETYVKSCKITDTGNLKKDFLYCSQSWQEKMMFQMQVARYFTDIPKNIATVVKAISPVEVLNNVYKLTGYLVKCCAKCLYVKVGVKTTIHLLEN